MPPSTDAFAHLLRRCFAQNPDSNTPLPPVRSCLLAPPVLQVLQIADPFFFCLTQSSNSCHCRLAKDNSLTSKQAGRCLSFHCQCSEGSIEIEGRGAYCCQDLTSFTHGMLPILVPPMLRGKHCEREYLAGECTGRTTILPAGAHLIDLEVSTVEGEASSHGCAAGHLQVPEGSVQGGEGLLWCEGFLGKQKISMTCFKKCVSCTKQSTLSLIIVVSHPRTGCDSVS